MIRCESFDDYSAVDELYKQVFERENEAKLVENIRQSDCYISELSLVAQINHTVVGHILLSHINLVGEETFQVLGLAPLAVLPKFQRQGIGSALVRASVETADAMGEALVVVLGHPLFYSRFGFKPSVDYQIESPFPVPKNAFMVKLLKNYQKNYTGKVVYPPTFQGV